jgi:2-keto-4-pentenoate hydratase/2-oxohepta-3-ene-1,7-dioic acid hydratase in catechol pathway
MGTRIVGIRSETGSVTVGDLSADGTTVRVLTGLAEFWSAPRTWLSDGAHGTVVPIDQVELVPPVLPSARVLCIGLNYLDHVAEGSYADQELPSHPTIFGRWPASLTVSGAEVPMPSDEDGLDWEGEVVAWVGSHLADVTPQKALAAVVGYSAFNDLTARRAQKRTSQWTIGKNADRSGPVGPLVPAGEVGDLRAGLRLETRVNGTVVQSADTSQMIYSVGDTLSLISRTLTLRPGDLLATGTPSGVGYARTPSRLLQPGDVVEVEVDRLGTLRNRIVDGTVRTRRVTEPGR